METAYKDLISGNPKAANVIIFAHGAGAGMEHHFMQYFAQNLTNDDWQVVRFEFPYMQQMRETGKRRPPNPKSVLLEYWHQKIVQYRRKGKLVLAGKSMGGRMATMIADDLSADGLLIFGYPFHPPGKPEKLRTEHLHALQTPCLILQGERDNLGNREEVSAYLLSKNIELEWLVDGDHGLKPRKKSGFSERDHWQHAIHTSRDFLNTILKRSL